MGRRAFSVRVLRRPPYVLGLAVAAALAATVLGILALPVRSALAAKPSVVRELTKLRS